MGSAIPPKPSWPSAEAYGNAAARLGCDVAAIRAVSQVEAGKLGGFDREGIPIILYERHVFHRLTGGMYDHVRLPDVPEIQSYISHRYQDSRAYGPYSLQHPKLVLAVVHARNPALMSASWGLFQIMGENYQQAGFTSLRQFINAMYRTVDDHLDAFVSFIQNDPRLVKALREHAWSRFARIYNGPKYMLTGYHDRMASAYAFHLEGLGDVTRG